jgi:putative heme transporter
MAVLLAVGIYVLIPHLAGIEDSWRRAREAHPGWLAAAVAFELISFTGYVVLFKAVLGGGIVGWRVATLITLAGVAATRLLAAAGAGGVALTAWALRRAGRAPRETAVGLTAFLVLLYAAYILPMLIGAVGLWSGVLPGPRAPGLTSAAALFATAVIVAVLLLAWQPRGMTGLRGRLARSRAGGPITRLASASSAVPAGVRHALLLARTRDPLLLGGAVWWAFDIATLWACLSAFGDPPPLAALTVAYFVGMLGNLLPLPGGIGGVDGGMIAALIVVGAEPGLAVLGVLTYRLFALWLPTLLGIPSYVALVRRASRWRHGAPGSVVGRSPQGRHPG